MEHDSLIDGRGVPFRGVVAPDRFAGVAVVKSAEILQQFAARWRRCQMCDDWRHLEIHHIVGWPRRSDEATNLIRLCRTCHQRVQHSPDELPGVLYAKVSTDRPNTDWTRLTELRGRALPMPEPPEVIDLDE